MNKPGYSRIALNNYHSNADRMPMIRRLFQLFRRPRKKRQQASLLVMRLADMGVVHPGQNNDCVCAMCGEPVGIYPSGQAVLKFYPTLKIVCSICLPQKKSFDTLGALAEIDQGGATPVGARELTKIMSGPVRVGVR